MTNSNCEKLTNILKRIQTDSCDFIKAIEVRNIESAKQQQEAIDKLYLKSRWLMRPLLIGCSGSLFRSRDWENKYVAEMPGAILISANGRKIVSSGALSHTKKWMKRGRPVILYLRHLPRFPGDLEEDEMKHEDVKKIIDNPFVAYIIEGDYGREEDFKAMVAKYSFIRRRLAE